MLTIPRNKNMGGLKILKYIKQNDIHKWVIGLEQGKGGYQHWQVRLEARDGFFGFEQKTVPIYDAWGRQIDKQKITVKTGWLPENIPEAHCEEGSDKWDYETKEGIYWTSRDKPKNISQRFGRMKGAQEYVLNVLSRTNDRQIVVWYNESGGIGKSWLTGALWERKLAYKTSGNTAQAIIFDIANSYYYGEYRPNVVIDLPRNAKWTDDLYLAIEQIKDGLIGDPRYGAHMVNIDVKVLVMTNTMPNKKKLSADRWVIIEDDGTNQTKIAGSFT